MVLMTALLLAMVSAAVFPLSNNAEAAPEGAKFFTCDFSGLPKSEFDPGENLFVIGLGLDPNTTYELRIQKEPLEEGEALVESEDQTSLLYIVGTDDNGDMAPLDVPLWEIPTYAPITHRGYQEFVVIADQRGAGSGRYNASEDAIAYASIKGYPTWIFFLPLIVLVPLAALGVWFIVHWARRSKAETA